MSGLRWKRESLQDGVRRWCARNSSGFVMAEVIEQEAGHTCVVRNAYGGQRQGIAQNLDDAIAWCSDALGAAP